MKEVKTKSKGGAKPKFDLEDEENLLRIQGWARDGLDDKQIAEHIGYSAAHFSVLKGRTPKLSNALKKGRAPLDTIVESTMYRRAVGMSINVEQAFKCKEVSYDENGNRHETEVIKTVTLKQELPPDTTAQIFWLKNRKPDYWNKQPIRIDETTNGKEIQAPRVLSVKEAKALITELEDDF